jgi:hypothetical protein
VEDKRMDREDEEDTRTKKKKEKEEGGKVGRRERYHDNVEVV